MMGLDPGLKGGIAFYDGTNVNALSIPIKKASGKGNEIIWPQLVHDIEMGVMIHGADHAFLERVGARPGQGVSSMFKFGTVWGGLRGILATLKIPVTLVTPQQWKKAVGVGAEKKAAIARACDLFPASANDLKKDGPAEAALIAWYGYNKLSNMGV